jgi:hypothetical protein
MPEFFSSLTLRCVLPAGASASAILLSLLILPSGSWSGSPNLTPTYAQDVAPILAQHCLRCHQSGAIAFRFPFETYDQASSHASSIRDKVKSRQMPPWPVDASRSLAFHNDARLSEKDIETVVAWADAGAPQGSSTASRIGQLSNPASNPPADSAPNADPSPKWTKFEGRDPDLVISLPGDIHIPAQGAYPYMRVFVKVPFTGDRWVAASETRPTNPSVVHHMALTEVSLPEGMTPAQIEKSPLGQSGDIFVQPAVTAPDASFQPDMLSIYTPGTSQEVYGHSSGKLLHGGNNMYVIFNVHYTATGKPEIDRSKIALWFRSTPPEHQLFRVNGAGETILVRGKELLLDTPGEKAEGTHVAIPPIQPFEANYEITGLTAYTRAITLYQLHPHAHYRGKDFNYAVVYPDGREQNILSVPRFDHRWQMGYDLETPLELPAGSKLVVTAHYDNSRSRMHNPAPEKPVYFRAMNQSWDEMYTPFIQYSIDSSVAGQTPASPSQPLATAQSPLQIVSSVGCLRQSAGQWSLERASDPVPSQTQATSSQELTAARQKPLGTANIDLLGVTVFQPENSLGHKVAVKGVAIGPPTNLRLNVTSLQPVDPANSVGNTKPDDAACPN